MVGTYTTEQARTIDRDPYELMLEAAAGALADAGLSYADVDGVVTMMDMSHYNTATWTEQFWAAQLGDGY